MTAPDTLETAGGQFVAPTRLALADAAAGHDAPEERPDPATRGQLFQLSGVEKTYRTVNGRSTIALSATSLSIRQGEFVSIVGPSGCGKTTLLNLISGLLKPSGGTLLFRSRSHTGPSDRISLVFQRPVLLPWRKILDNVLLPVQILKLKPAEKYRQRARELLALVGLGDFADAFPRELSGGMQQRASIARALVYETDALLMDEPFAALDAMTREEMNLELLRLWQLTGSTVVFVTHNIAEAVLMSDRVVVMTPRPGRIREIVDVGLPRPRTLEMMGQSDFGAIANGIRGLLDHHTARGRPEGPRNGQGSTPDA